MKPPLTLIYSAHIFYSESLHLLELLIYLTPQEQGVLKVGKNDYVKSIDGVGLLFWQGGLKSRVFGEEFGVGLPNALPIRVGIHKLQALGRGEYHAAGQAARPARAHLQRLLATRLGIRVPHLLLLDGITNGAAPPDVRRR